MKNRTFANKSENKTVNKLKAKGRVPGKPSRKRNKWKQSNQEPRKFNP